MESLSRPALAAANPTPSAHSFVLWSSELLVNPLQPLSSVLELKHLDPPERRTTSKARLPRVAESDSERKQGRIRPIDPCPPSSFLWCPPARSTTPSARLPPGLAASWLQPPFSPCAREELHLILLPPLNASLLSMLGFFLGCLFLRTPSDELLVLDHTYSSRRPLVSHQCGRRCRQGFCPFVFVMPNFRAFAPAHAAPKPSALLSPRDLLLLSSAKT